MARHSRSLPSTRNTGRNAARAALITGGAKRVGSAIALALARNGYDIALHYHRSRKEASTLQADIRALGVKCELFTANLADAETLAPLVDKAFVAFPHLSLLINNASIFERRSFPESSIALFDQQVAVNARAPIFLTQAFAARAKHGHVINLLDSDVVRQHGSHFMYLLSKKMLADFTRMAARELSHVQVNAICPGVVLPSDQNPPGYERQLVRKLPLGTLARTEDIVSSVLWLAEQPRITGQLIFNDSGQHLL